MSHPRSALTTLLLPFSAAAESSRKTPGKRFRHRVRGMLGRLVPGAPHAAKGPLPTGRTLMPLAQAPRGRWVRVVEIHGGHERFRRLSAMGLYPDARVQVLSAGKWGPVIVKCGETRLAVGRNVAQAVLVSGAES